MTVSADQEKLYGSLVVPHFAAQAMVRSRPHLAARPVVVMLGIRPNEKVFALNHVALSLGLTPGMTRTEAETFPAVELLTHSPVEEQAARQVLLESTVRFTPSVEVLGTQPNLECLLDLTGTERVLGDPVTLGNKIISSLAELGFDAFIALSPNADAGITLARNSSRMPHRAIAMYVPQEKLSRALAPLSVESLRLDEEQQDRFTAWGICTLGELAALPETGLIARMGQAGKQLCMRARGVLPHLLQPAVEPFLLEEIIEFDDPIETLEPLLFCISPMLGQLIVRAENRALALASLTLTLSLEQHHDRTLSNEVELPMQEQPEPKYVPPAFRPRLTLITSPTATEPPLVDRIESYGRLPKSSAETAAKVDVALQLAAKPQTAWSTLHSRPPAQSDVTEQFERTIQPAVPTLDRALLLKMLQLDLAAHPPPGFIRRMRIFAAAGDISRIQLGLFTPPMPEATRFEDTHARLVSVLGEGNVGRVTPLDTHARDAFAVERFKVPTSVGKSAAMHSMGRPATVARHLRPPVEVRVSLFDRYIRYFVFESRRFEVLRCYGPWRTSGHWWQPEVWSSDTWDLAATSVCEDEEALFCVLAHDLLRDRWQVDAIYD